MNLSSNFRPKEGELLTTSFTSTRHRRNLSNPGGLQYNMDVPSSNSTASTSITPGYNSSSGGSKVDNRLSADTNILQV